MEQPQQPLYTQQLHPHQPRNANVLHQAELAAAGINTQVAVWLTTHVGTMYCAYLFSGIGIGSLVGVFTNNTFLALLFGSISSYFLQLVLLPVLAVGQSVLGRKAELQAEEQFHTTEKIYHDMGEVMNHLNVLDTMLQEVQTLLQVKQPKGKS